MTREEITQNKLAARSRAEPNDSARMEDFKRARFLERLDCAAFDVTEFEAEFIESCLRRAVEGNGFHTIVFTPRQRAVADEMRKKYEGRL